MKELTLTNTSQTALVDDEEFSRLSEHTWCANITIGGKIGRAHV